MEQQLAFQHKRYIQWMLYLSTALAIWKKQYHHELYICGFHTAVLYQL
jgi:hypothetical protein